MPAPPDEARPTEFIPQPKYNPLTSGDSPRMNPLSGVKLSGPFSSILTSAVSSAGSRCRALAIIGSKWSQSSANSPKAKSGPMASGLIGLPIGSKHPTNRPPESSRI